MKTRYQPIYYKAVIAGEDVSNNIVRIKLDRGLNIISTLSLTLIDKGYSFKAGDQINLSMYCEDKISQIFLGYLDSADRKLINLQQITYNFSDILKVLANTTVNIFSPTYGQTLMGFLRTSAEKAIEYICYSLCKLPQGTVKRYDEIQLTEAPLAFKGIYDSLGLPSSGIAQPEASEPLSSYPTPSFGADKPVTIYSQPTGDFTGGLWKTISKYASMNSLDPYFVAALIKLESGFRVDAVSETNDYGLMQINYNTYQAHAHDRRYVMEGVKSVNDLADAQNPMSAEYNLYFGCRLLRDRLDTASTHTSDSLEAMRLAAALYHLPKVIDVYDHFVGQNAINYTPNPDEQAIWDEGMTNYANIIMEYYFSFLEFKPEQTEVTTEATPTWADPLQDLPNYVITQPQGQRADGSLHRGTDFACPLMTEVYAPNDGIITAAHIWSALDGIQGMNSYGSYVDLHCEVGSETYDFRFAHLAQIPDGIQSGRDVKKGDIIGYTGTTGESTGPHLHLEVRKNGELTDPTGADSPFYYDFANWNPPQTSITQAEAVMSKATNLSAIDLTAQYEQTAYDLFKQLTEFALWDYFAMNDKIVLIRPDYFKTSLSQISLDDLILPFSVSWNDSIITDVYVTGNPLGLVLSSGEVSPDISKLQAMGSASIESVPEVKKYFETLKIQPATHLLSVSKPMFRNSQQCEEYAKYLLKKSARFFLSGTLRLVPPELTALNVYTLSTEDKKYSFYISLPSLTYEHGQSVFTYPLMMGKEL